MEKLYTVVRADLPPGAQIAQSCHALAEFAADHQVSFTAWARPTQRNIVCLATDEATIRKIMGTLEENAVPYSAFVEQDYGDQITALAVPESGGRLLSSLPLAGRKH